MDKTLRQYLSEANDFHQYLDKNFLLMNNSAIEEKILELKSNIKTLQTVVYQLANISNIAIRSMYAKKDLIKNISINVENINTVPNFYDVGTLISLNEESNIKITENISIPAAIVEKVDDIPLNKLYYVKDINQFAINIGGLIIQGNLGNISNYGEKLTTRCEYGTDCKSLQKYADLYKETGTTIDLPCNYYHDVDDYKKLNLPISNIPRNFTTGSWLYSTNKTTKTYFTRHIGSKENLEYDLSTIKQIQYKEEIFNREGQLIHDLIIYIILNNKKMLNRHVPWKKMPTK